MKNLNVVILAKHSNKEIADHCNTRGYYDENDYENIPNSQNDLHRVKILERIKYIDATYYLGVTNNGQIYKFRPDQIIELDNRENSLDVLLKEKSQEKS